MGRMEPQSGLLAPVPIDVLRELAEDSLRVIVGSSDYHALVDDEPGDMVWAEELATELSASHRGKHYAFGLARDDSSDLTIAEDGRILSRDEGAIDDIARKLDCPLAPEPAPSAGPSRFIAVEGAGPDEVALAIGVEPAPRRHLERTELGTLGWVDGGDLALFAGEVSRRLGRRVFVVTDEPVRFWVKIFDGGEAGRFEDPPTSWGDRGRVTAVLGETTARGIRRKLGLPG